MTTRTPTQVASHAQKYFIRLSSGGKEKRRSSIHDITTVNMTDMTAAPPVGESSGIYIPPPNPFDSGVNYGVKVEQVSVSR